jgi:hypothetical protein
MMYNSPWSRFELTTSVVIGTDCIGSGKSNYHTITATTVPVLLITNIKITPFIYSLGRYALIFFVYWYINRSCMIQYCILGVHYWYNTRKDMSCDEFYPVFLLYNGGQLNAFGWAFQAHMTSPHMEHPPKATIKVC